MPILVSPAEPKIFHSLGTVSSLAETHGSDFLIATPKGFVGVQRKAVLDFIASFLNGRLQEELMRMGGLPRRVLLIEGTPLWDFDGTIQAVSNDSSVKSRSVTQSRFRRETWWGVMLTVQESGVFVMETKSLHETGQFLTRLDAWAQKEKHLSLVARPGPEGTMGGVGRVTRRAWLVHLLQSFRGIGPEAAGAIVDHFDGVPLRWTVDEKELCQVPGIGKVRAKLLLEALATGLSNDEG